MNFDNQFREKTVIVTGSAGGIGKEIARSYAMAGANVIVGDINAALGSQTVEKINQDGGKALFSELDVTGQDSVNEMVKTALDNYGNIDILVNSAGITGQGFVNFSKITLEQWDLVSEVNMKGTVRCCKSVLDTFKKNRSGKIVNISSVAGRMPSVGLAHYGASKAAVINFTKTSAFELAGYNINVNAICPGWIWTPIYNDNKPLKQMAEKIGKSPRQIFMDLVKQRCPLQREQTEEDVANMTLFLTSEMTRNVTGQAINVDGGAIMS